MKNTTKFLFLFLAVCTSYVVKAQSVLNPADSVYNYDSMNPPQQPAWGQIGKWVRTPRMTWNTNSYKAYIYKGIPFRIKFPKTYNPALNDGKKYPMLIFWHGLGEAAANIYDNEFHLLLGCEMFKNTIDNGNFDGYVIAMQTQAELSGFFGSVHYQSMQEIIEYMVLNNKLDRFQVMNNGLSSGGIASIDMFRQFPTYISAINAMAPPGDYTSSEIVNKIKFTPFWYSNGGQDDNPPPSVADNLYSVMKSAGANFRKLTYPNNYHNTWDNTWSEYDFWPFMKRAYASNPWALYGKTAFNPGETFTVTLGLAPGFDGYEWRKDGVVITGATTNSIQATQLGTYDARVLKGGTWSEWSRIPVQLRTNDPSIIHIEAEDFTTMSGITVETTSDAGGGLNVAWQDNNGDWMDYSVNVPAAGTYNVNFRVATMFDGPQFQLRDAAQNILATVNVPNTGWFQSWQTVTVPVSLPAGQQTLRIYTSTANNGWNINWWEILLGGTTPVNKVPVVNAGSPQTITLPQNSVQLSGTASDPDGTITSYLWTKVSGPSGEVFSSATSAQTTVSNLSQGSYTFRLTATDNSGGSASSDVPVTVNAATTTPSTRIEAENYIAMFGIQTEPTSDVGGGLNVGWQDDNDWMDYSVNVSTTGAYTVNFRVASMFTGAQFQLRDQSGAALATLVVPNTGNFQSWQTISAQVSLTAGSQTLRVYTTAANGGWNLNWLELQGGSSTTPTNQPPQVTAGTAQTITLPTSSVQLNGSASDADGTIVSYSWSQLSGPSTASIGSPGSAATTVSGLVEGTYLFQLRVTDNGGATASASVSVTVNSATNQPPQVSAGTAKTITLPTSSVQLNGSASDADGTIVSYSWSQLSGPSTASISSPGSASTTVSGLVEGSYLFQLTVTDNGGAAASASVSVTVNAGTNQPPQVSAGSAQTITLPTSSVQLNGSASDADGSIASYSWSQLSGPSTASISSPGSASTTVSGLVEGSYLFQLMVVDNGGASASASVSVTVNAATPPPPPAVSIRIEAENYSAMSGIQTEPTQDAGGGLDVYSQDVNDWMDYSVNIPTAGTYNLNFRVACVSNGSQFEVRGSNGALIIKLTVPNTGNLQSWQTISTQVSLPAGQQTIRIQTVKTKKSWNLNWWEITSPGVTAARVGNISEINSISQELKVYPNPVRDRFVLKLDNAYRGPMKVEVINLLGMVQKQFVLNKRNDGTENFTVSAEGLAPGRYIIRIVQNNSIQTTGILKQ